MKNETIFSVLDLAKLILFGKNQIHSKEGFLLHDLLLNHSIISLYVYMKKISIMIQITSKLKEMEQMSIHLSVLSQKKNILDKNSAQKSHNVYSILSLLHVSYKPTNVTDITSKRFCKLSNLTFYRKRHFYPNILNQMKNAN